MLKLYIVSRLTVIINVVVIDILLRINTVVRKPEPPHVVLACRVLFPRNRTGTGNPRAYSNDLAGTAAAVWFCFQLA